MNQTHLTDLQIMEWLKEVKDPEIPVLSIVDMGIVREVNIDSGKVSLTITPTFVGCPALDMIVDEIKSTLKNKGVVDVNVQVSFKHPWSSDDLSEEGRKALKKFGLAPPASGAVISDIEILEYAECPRCNSHNTVLKSLFGPTLCRSIHYCEDCRESFEQFKPI